MNNEPQRRRVDQPILKFINTWKAPMSAFAGAIISVWITITWADDKLRKVEQVPAVVEAVLQMKINHDLVDVRLSRIEDRQARMEKRLGLINDRVSDQLDVIIDKLK